MNGAANGAMDSSPVIVNVYDMSTVNNYISNIGLGVFHTGVEVYSREYCYGGHQFGGSGIFEMSPKDAANLGSNYTLKTSIVLGLTEFTYHDVCDILSSMEQEFCGDKYHLLRKNCNHFSSAFVETLCGASLPKWINRLAVVSTKLPFIERTIPREWLTPIPLEEEQEVNTSRQESGSIGSSVPSTSRRTLFGVAGRSNSLTATESSTTTTSSTSSTDRSRGGSSGGGEEWRQFYTNVSNLFRTRSAFPPTSVQSNRSHGTPEKRSS